MIDDGYPLPGSGGFMKIGVLTEGGDRYGFGHLSRCAALIQAFQHLMPDVTAEFLIKGSRQAGKFMRAFPHRFSIVEWTKQPGSALRLARECQIILIDSYTASAPVFTRLRAQSAALTVAVDDYRRLDYDADAVINPSVYGQRLKFKGGKLTRYFLGKEFIILRRPFWKILKHPVRKNVSHILITFGATDQRRLIWRAINELRKMEPRFRFTVVSPHAAGRESAQVRWMGSVNAKRFLDLIRASDLCIAGCGQTLNELARCGLPTIGIGFTEDQRMNFNAWRRSGFLKFGFWRSEPRLLSRITQAVSRLSARSFRSILSCRGQKLVDGQGALRIAEALLDHGKAMRLRRAEFRDSRSLYQWRNHPEVRRNSFQTGRIPYAHHQKWLAATLRRRNRRIYVAETLSGKHKIGVIRFHKEKEGAQVSVGLNPKFFGRGLGTSLIRIGSQKFIEETRLKHPIVAEIKRENKASLRAFYKAGYRTNPRFSAGNSNVCVLTFNPKKAVLA